MNAKFRTLWYDCAAPVFFLAFSIAFLVASYRYGPASREIPLAVGYAGLALAIVDLLTRLQSPLGRIMKRLLSPGTEPVVVGIADGGVPLAREAYAIAWLVCFVAATLTLGLLATVPVHVYLYMVFWGGRTRVHGALGAVGATAFIYLLFEVLLRNPLYRGMLFD